MQTSETQMESIAQEILAQIRTNIIMNMRFLDMAVFRLRPTPGGTSLATDGDMLYYHPVWLLKRYRADGSALAHDYMHVLLHCIFRHPFVHTLIDQELWNLACDIAAEGLICDLKQPHLAARDDGRRQQVLDELRTHVKPLTAEKLYHYFQDHPPKHDWVRLFHADDHAVWYQPPQMRNAGSPSGQGKSKNNQNKKESQTGLKKETKRDPTNGQHPGSDQAPQPDPSNDPQQGPENTPQSDASNESQPGSGNGPASDPSNDAQQGSENASQPNSSNGSQPGSANVPQSGSPKESSSESGSADSDASAPSAQSTLEDEWRDISEHVQMDLETFSMQQGISAGDMQQMLAELNREKYDYEAFLKKFAVMGEVMKINDDEFDYIFYTYGLKRYRNMPLIDPLEYKEVKRIREFVIAIDTSGSTSGELVNRFLTKTYNILMSTESFFSKVNLHIVQCDAQLQEAVKITKREEFEDYLRRMTIHGLGGTDFRPVFSYVDQLIRQHEFNHLKGMIYFTDGRGTFPERKPDYTTAFVFIQDEFNNLAVPPWAIKLILEKDEL